MAIVAFVRVLVDRVTSGHTSVTEVSETSLTSLYAAPAPDWLRVNMVSTVDGAATGEDGVTGSVNNPADRQVFHTLRRMADCIVVGAGTARAEGYRPVDRPTVVVSRRGDLPPDLRGGPVGAVLLATCGTAPGLAESREALGADHVVVLGNDTVDLSSLRGALAERGLRDVLSEGGPHLLGDLLAAGAVDELCATLVPRVVAGDGPRITAGAWLDTDLELRLLLEQDSTLLGRWFVT
jgi:riboflavin biosynthesis pyrimidine reductase